MIIETKYSEGDRIYFIRDSFYGKSKVINGIIIEVKGSFAGNVSDNRYAVKISGTLYHVPEENAFLTKEELIASL